MAEGIDTKPIENLIRGLLRPLAAATDSPVAATRLLRDLGYLPPAAVPALATLGPIMASIEEGVVELRAALEAEDDGALITAVLRLLVDIGRFFDAVKTIVDAMQTAFAGTTFLTATNLIAELPERLASYIVVRFLEDEHPTVHAVLILLNVVTNEDVTDTPTPFHFPHRHREIHWDRIATLFSDPRAALNTMLWNGNSLRYLPIISILHRLFTSLGLPAGFAKPQYALLSALNSGNDLTARPDYDRLISLDLPLYRDPVASVGLEVYPIVNVTSGDVEGLGVGVGLGLELIIPLGDAYEMRIKASAAAGNAFGVMVKRGSPPQLVSGLTGANPAAIAAGIQFGASLAVEPTDSAPEQPLVRLGIGGSRFEIGSGALRLGYERLGKERFFIEGDLRQGLVVIAAGNADGFLAKILPPDGIQANFDLGVGFGTDAGLYFSGSGGIEIQLPLHIELGPIEIETLSIALKITTQGIPLELGATFKASLGPIKAVVENVGLRAVFSFPQGGGNLGPANLAFGFKPPNGVGFSIDAGVVKGGGYLYFDFDREEYAGGLELTIAEFLSLKAIGLVTTKMPDGSKGFSLLIIITAEFSPGLQLGMGFNLIGVGGLLGLNRTVVLEALGLGVRTGAVNGIMFPVDPVANAPRIISDLRVIFPPYVGRFLIGPMAKIGWGPFMSLALGVIIEIPGNLAILGVLKAVLPDEEAEVLKLQVNFLGAIEFDKKRGWFFAALYESRIVFITIEGEFGVLIAVGDDANFVLSAGGFHPTFDPPPLPFPSPRRISLSIIDTAYAKIRAECYFAITTNTVQAGMRAELFFGFDSIALEGHIAFDALLRFSPFYLIVEISAGASLKAFGVGVFTIDLAFTLEGPTPWRVRGRGSIKLLFFTVSADFDQTFGEVIEAISDPILLIPLVKLELDNATNWRALPPISSNLLVSVRNLGLTSDVLVLHPLGTLEVSQNLIPLGLTLEKVGAQLPADGNRFTLSLGAGGLTKRSDARRGFAPAQFRNYSDAQKLSAPAFQSEASGLELGVSGAELRTGRAVKRSLRYELATLDTYYRRAVRRFKTLSRGLFRHFIKGGAVSKSTLSKTRREQAQPFGDRIEVSVDLYAVVFTADNRAVSPATAGFASESEAQEWLQGATAADPNLGAAIQVVPATEMSHPA